MTKQTSQGQQEEQRQEQHMAARDQKDCGGDKKSNEGESHSVTLRVQRWVEADAAWRGGHGSAPDSAVGAAIS
jgi:hypothetical protein